MNTQDLKDFSLLLEFGEDDREELVELIDEETLAAGDSIFAEGDEADALYLVAEGGVRVAGSRHGSLGLIGEGGSLGAVSLVVVGRREANAVAESDCRLFVLSRSGFRRLAEDAPRTACRLAEAIIREHAIALRGNLPLFDGFATTPAS